MNLQIVLAFLTATFFSKVNTAQAIAYLYIFGSGLIAGSLIRNFIEGGKFPSKFSKYYQMDVFNNHITFI
jgi:hypothetical protein